VNGVGCLGGKIANKVCIFERYFGKKNYASIPVRHKKKKKIAEGDGKWQDTN
jgi:hypothetical protein